MPDASGKLYAAARDITEQKTAAASLRRALSFQSALLESAAIAIIATDRQGTFTSFNGAAERMLGYARDEVIGKLTPKALHKPAEVVARAAELSRELVRPFTPGFDVFTTVPRERGVEEREWTFVRKDGSEFPAQLSVTPLRDEAENIDGYLGIAVDVTERRRAAAAIRESEERFRLMVAGVSDYAILMLDPAGHVATWNDGAERVKGFRAEEIVGQHFSRFYTPEDLARGKPAETLRLAAQDGSYEDKGGWRVRKDGSRFFANSVLTAMRDEAGTLRGFSKITRDITQRKRDEERLQEATRKLERSNRDLSEFASIASHDLQEPLRKIRTFGDRLKSKLTDASPDALDSLERMNGAAMRMQQLISNLLAYSRVSSRAQAPVAVDLNHVLKDVLSDLDARIEETGGRVEVSLLPIVQGDPTQLRQLFQNLVGNALKFRKPDEAPRVRVAVDSGQLVVEDNGIGFEQRYAERIFGIFERLHARQEYEGTGIGLSICRKIVERHGGTIEAHGEPGRGSRFTITFPSTS